MFLSFICCKVNNYFCIYQIKSHLFSNKMYFYCFSLSLSIHFAQILRIFSRARSFRVFRVIRSFNKLAQERSVRSVKSDVSILSMFRYNSTLSNSTCAHGAQFNTQHSTLNIHIVAHPGARTCATPCRGGRCAACYSRGPQAAINKKIPDYDL